LSPQAKKTEADVPFTLSTSTSYEKKISSNPYFTGKSPQGATLPAMPQPNLQVLNSIELPLQAESKKPY
jgi:hypothetical protein